MSNTSMGPIDETVRQRFEQAWIDGRPEPIERLLPVADDARYLGTLEELVAIDLEFAWKATLNSPSGIDRPNSIEAYLERFDRLNDADAVRRLIQQEFLVRKRCGDRPSLSEYRRRFPDLDLTADEFEGLQSVGEQPAAPVPGEHMDRYLLTTEHARGGFARVWRAHDPKLDREIALKQLDEQFVTDDDIRRRFVIESRITAKLEHPGIVPVYDTGGLEAECPYYTMKLVRGETLADAIRRYHALDETSGASRLEQLRLLNSFLAVARTMEFAHARDVLHRDLKPQNIILGDHGETIVLDWGLAKVFTDAERTSRMSRGDEPILQVDVEATHAGTIQGTPSYMSPEQAGGRGDLVDERSDVYALGVILYQLLTGRRPFPGKTREQILRQVIGAVPMPPRVIDTQVPRPLEAICLKAMAKRPEARYQSAGELARDLERYLADEPIRSWSEPFTHRVARWARRHGAWVRAGAAALLLVTIVSIGAAAWVNRARRETERQRDVAEEARQSEAQQHRIAQQERDAAELARNRAERDRLRAVEAEQTARDEADTAKSVASVLAGVFQGSDFFGLTGYEFPGDAPGRADLTARELLELGERTVRERLAERPVVRARLMTIIGTTYLSLGMLEKAAALSERTLALRRELYPEPHPELADSIRNHGTVRYLQGYYEEANALLHEAVDMRRSLDEHDPLALALDEIALAWSMIEYDEQLDLEARLEESERLMRKALEVRRELLGETHRDVAYASVGLAIVLINRNKPLEAVQVINDASRTFSQLEGRRNPLEPFTSLIAASVALQLNDAEAAQRQIEKTIELAARTYGEGHAIVTYMMLYFGGGLVPGHEVLDVEFKEKLLRRAVSQAREGVGDHPRTVQFLEPLAILLQNQGKLDEEEEICRQMADIIRNCLGKNHVRYGNALDRHAWVLLAKNDLDAAKDKFDTALEVFQSTESDQDLAVAQTKSNLAFVRLRQGQQQLRPDLATSDGEAQPDTADYDAAVSKYLDALEMFRQCLDKDDVRVAFALTNLAAARDEIGQYDQGEAECRRAIAMLERLPLTPTYDLATARVVLGAILLHKGDPAAAEPYLREAVQFRRKAFPDGNWFRANAESILGGCLVKLEHYNEAEELLLASAPVLQSDPGASRAHKIRAIQRVIDLYESQGNADAAAPFREQLRAVALGKEKKETDTSPEGDDSAN